jgi:cyclohexadieny/prephenate dehydrogenase / 3-phosphoshikimate 1-carboxyvinyltransferase
MISMKTQVQYGNLSFFGAFMGSQNYHCQPSGPLRGELLVPGDKSISHRALILSAMADGVTEITGFLAGEDNLATLQAMRQLGVPIEYEQGSSTVRVTGVGLHGLTCSDQALNLGNSGTAMRLLAGLLAWQPFSSELTGDASLNSRPMRRIADPLEQMGAEITLSAAGTAPIRIKGQAKKLTGLKYTMPVASAQIKSAILLAGLGCSEVVEIADPGVSRDHTERMMAYLGLPISTPVSPHLMRGPWEVQLAPCKSFAAKPLEIVGDISSAAFFLVAASIVPGSDLLLKNVGINPTRAGIIELLQRMGADISLSAERVSTGGEPVADLRVRFSQLQGIDIKAADVPRAIDELPVLLVAAAVAAGETRLSGAKELRVKESDRLHAMVAGLQAMGIAVVETADGLVLQGGRLCGAELHSYGDHRMAMAFAVASAVAGEAVIVHDVAGVQTSFPDFMASAQEVGFRIKEESSE